MLSSYGFILLFLFLHYSTKIFLGGSLCCCYSFKIFNHTRVLRVNVFRFDRFAKVTVKDWIFGLANSEKWWLLEFSSHRVVVAVVNLSTYIQTYIDFLSFSLSLPMLYHVLFCSLFVCLFLPVLYVSCANVMFLFVFISIFFRRLVILYFGGWM